MADSFRRLLDKKSGLGGVHCQCCNDYHGKEKPKLNRRVRSQIKEEAKKEAKEDIKNMEDEIIDKTVNNVKEGKNEA